MISPPQSPEALLERCRMIEGMTLGQLALAQQMDISLDPRQSKGLVGLLLERTLGATAGQQAKPDFLDLAIELKTLPIGRHGVPVESTYVTRIPLLTIHQQQWLTSTCYIKLRHVLWVPIEADDQIPWLHRRIGRSFLWSPSADDFQILKTDWELLTNMIAMGQLEDLDARVGTYLQVRPKGMDGRALAQAYDREGNLIKTLPRGFYLRRLLTTQIWKNSLTE